MEGIPIGIAAYKLEDRKIRVLLFYVCSPFRGKDYERIAILQLVDSFKSLSWVEEIEILLHPFCRFIDDDRFLKNIGFEVQEWVWMSKSLDRSEEIVSCSPEIRCEITPWDERTASDIAKLDIEAKILLKSRESDFNIKASKICFKGEEVVGFILVSTSGSKGVVKYIFVSEEFRRKGIGRALLRASLKQLQDEGIKSVIAELNMENLASISLFWSLGFSICCRAHLVAVIRKISHSNYLPSQR